MRVVVNVKLKNGVLDPQGKAVSHALNSLGFEVGEVRIGKQIVLDIAGDDKEKIKAQAQKMCEELLANPVIEDFEIVL